MFYSIAEPILIYHIFFIFQLSEPKNHYNILSTNIFQNAKPTFPWVSSSPPQGLLQSHKLTLPKRSFTPFPIFHSTSHEGSNTFPLKHTSENKPRLTYISKTQTCVSNGISYPHVISAQTDPLSIIPSEKTST